MNSQSNTINFDTLTENIQSIVPNKEFPNYDSSLLSLPVFIIVGHSTYSLDTDNEVPLMTVPDDCFVVHPSPPGSYCLYSSSLHEESDDNILKQNKEIIMNSLFNNSQTYTSRIGLIKEISSGVLPSQRKDHRPGYFLPQSNIIDKTISFLDEDSPDVQDRGLLNNGYGIFKLVNPHDTIDQYVNIGTYTDVNLFYTDIRKSGGRELEKAIKRKGHLSSSEIMKYCGKGVYIFASCSELNIYQNDTYVSEKNLKLYRTIRNNLLSYHHKFSKQWDQFCETLDVPLPEYQIVMSVENQRFTSNRVRKRTMKVEGKNKKPVKRNKSLKKKKPKK